MGFRRSVGLLALVAAALAAYGAYAPASVEKWSPTAGAYAWKLHDLLPASATGGQASATPNAAPAAAAPTAPDIPPVSVVVAKAARKDLPWRVDAIGTVQ